MNCMLTNSSEAREHHAPFLQKLSFSKPHSHFRNLPSSYCDARQSSRNARTYRAISPLVLPPTMFSLIGRTEVDLHAGNKKVVCYDGTGQRDKRVHFVVRNCFLLAHNDIYPCFPRSMCFFPALLFTKKNHMGNLKNQT